MQTEINAQINKEVFSAYLYLSMSAYCESINLSGSAHWLRKQSEEEWGHALKLFGYITARDGRVELKAIDKPASDFKSLVDVFKNILVHEQSITASINSLYGLAVKENDYATQTFLQWYITEQIEEEKAASEILEQLKMVGEHGPAQLMLDRHLASR